ncbi:type I-E CRISPR-associated protein Cse2/CasB [Thermostichus vulcanus]|uniref:Type I-E CRISPR-associated protein Cse2/CasB n=1 Tax=Thermostichus vulcanus str. 'Rupite' TaxID=2813851 RepID=A0ABT0CC54_THEVL|nr:type I-E CRISPR-associated protein Cse2/CasB [Thermostichus vulcanus]MCJ2543326.1 type I-E CRISPR-associated protein Cse2/CasB [Thermostichus vulcanus str. 'Rupite']
MTTTQTPPRLERETKFLQAIRDRIKNDTGARATFKRALSGEHHHLRKVYPFTLPYLAGIHEWQQDIWIFVACLSTYHAQEKEPTPRSFAQSCLDLHNSSASKGVERRFRSLLDTDLVDIQSPITALVRLIKSKKDKKIPVYYPQLIADLCFWDHPDQFIQDQWAKTFWGATPLNEVKP